MGAELPQYFEWGAGVSFSPPKKILYPYKFKTKKGSEIMHI